jgi:hypothetical protein
MYTDKSNTDYPKTVEIRNTLGGMIWQIYHVENVGEAKIISKNARNNGFEAITLENHQPEEEETFVGWRESEGGKNLIKEALEIKT